MKTIGSAAIQLSREVVTRLEERLLTARAELTEIEGQVAEAAAHGDLRENREFELANQQKELKQSTISQLEQVLGSACVVEVDTNQRYTKVSLMTRVELLELVSNVPESIYIVIDTLGDVGHVGLDNVQVSPDKVSDESHFGRTLMGKPVDSIITFGEKKYKILKVTAIDYNEFFNG